MDIDLDQARRRAKELLRAARDGTAQLRDDRAPRLDDAQHAVARELERLAGLVCGDARDGLRVAGAMGAQQLLGLLAQLLQARSGRQGCG